MACVSFKDDLFHPRESVPNARRAVTTSSDKMLAVGAEGRVVDVPSLVTFAREFILARLGIPDAFTSEDKSAVNAECDRGNANAVVAINGELLFARCCFPNSSYVVVPIVSSG